MQSFSELKYRNIEYRNMVTCLGVEMPGTYKRMIADKAAAAAVTLKELCCYAEFL